MSLLYLKILIHLHRGAIGTLFGCRLAGHRCLLINHLPRDGDDVVLDKLLAHILDVCGLKISTLLGSKQCRQILTLLRVDLADISRLQLLLAQLGLFLYSLLITLSKANKLLHLVYVMLAFLVEVLHLQGLSPNMLVQVHQHVLFQSCLPVVDRNAVVVAVETMNEGLNRRLVQVTQIGRCLPGLLAHYNSLRLNETERIDDHLALH